MPIFMGGAVLSIGGAAIAGDYPSAGNSLVTIAPSRMIGWKCTLAWLCITTVIHRRPRVTIL
jgi:hypothetical protein